MSQLVTAKVYLCAISRKSPENLDLCRQHGMWGFTVKAERWAYAVHPGDILWFYMGRRGIVALAKVVAPAVRFAAGEQAPWRDGRSYAFRLPIKWIADLSTPIPTAIQRDRKRYTCDKELGFDNNSLQRGFFPLNPAAHALLLERSGISLDPPPNPGKAQTGIREGPPVDGPVLPVDATRNGTPAQDLPKATSEHTRAQWQLARIARNLGLSAWIPAGDRGAVCQGAILKEYCVDRLPSMGLPDQVRSIIENIDVLWIENEVVVCGFEVEHSTAIYSGILRLSDLIARQPYTTIRLFIVSGSERRDKVKQELARPTFSKIVTQANEPLAKVCKYISYERLAESLQDTEKFGRYLKHGWVQWVDAELGEPLT